MKPKTKLKVAAEEIKEILRKHDIAASIVLHTEGHGEYLNHLTTSYSCAHQYENDSLRFYSKRADYDSKEAQIDKQRSTANMFAILTDLVARNFMTLKPISQKFDEIVGAEHSEGTYDDR